MRRVLFVAGAAGVILLASCEKPLGLETGQYKTCGISQTLSPDENQFCKSCLETRCCGKLGPCVNDATCNQELEGAFTCTRGHLTENSRPTQDVPGWIKEDCSTALVSNAVDGKTAYGCASDLCAQDCFPGKSCRLDPVVVTLHPRECSRERLEQKCCTQINECVADQRCRQLLLCLADQGCLGAASVGAGPGGTTPACAQACAQYFNVVAAVLDPFVKCVGESGACTPLADASTD